MNEFNAVSTEELNQIDGGGTFASPDGKIKFNEFVIKKTTDVSSASF
jgi:bacteriocin-like protein